MKKGLNVIYRPSHYQVPVMEIIKEFEAWRNFDLELNMTVVKKGAEAQRLLVEKEVDVAIGQHLRPLADRLKGIPIVYLAQGQNRTNDRLAYRSDMDITSLGDLKGKRIATTKSFNHHPMLTIRLFLKRAGLDLEKDEVQLLPIADDLKGRLNAVSKAEADAIFVHPPFDLKAEKMGLKVINLPQMPMISGITVTALSPFVTQNKAEIIKLLKTLLFGIWFFKTRREETIDVLRKRLAREMELDDNNSIRYIYECTAKSLERKLYPTIEAIRNVHAVAQIPYPEVKKLNPLSMWDLHYMREIDEDGFVDDLYSS